MRCVGFDDAGSFYDLVRPVLGRREVENSLFLGVAKRLVANRQPALMLALKSEAEVDAAALRTPPYPLQVWGVAPPALERLADGVRAVDEAVPAVIGLADSATVFADRWVAGAGQAWRLEHDTTFYALRAVDHPRTAAGGVLRLATPDDQAWLTEWFASFAEEAALPTRERGVEHARRFTGGKLRRAELFLWQDHGRPVAFVGFSPTGITGARVGPVMTLPAARGKGYASAAVAALSQRLLDDGHGWCGLFADVRNAASNRIYQRLGYREACQYRSIAFPAIPSERDTP